MFASSKLIDLNESSLAAKNELKKFDKILGLRIGVQRALDIANKLPLKSSIISNNDNNDNNNELYEEINNKINHLLSESISLLNFNNDKNNNNNDHNSNTKKNKKRKKDIIWDDVVSSQSELKPEWERVINKFHSRLHFGSEHKKSNMKVFNETIWDQIKVLMNDDDRVIEKSTMPFNDSNRIDKVNNRNDDDNYNNDNINNNYDVEVYDDRQFYSTLLKSFLLSNANDNKGMSEDDLADLRRYKKKKNNVDRKASKGRKLRYNVHTKLQNFMFPIPYANSTNDNDADRIMQSLFQ